MLEYNVRVKLPTRNMFSNLPGGDVEFEDAYRLAIFEKLPFGFETDWESKDNWPVDKNGLTMVKLYCIDRTMALEKLQDKMNKMLKIIKEMRQHSQIAANFGQVGSLR